MSAPTEATRLIYFGSREWVDVPEGWTLRQTHTHIRERGALPLWGRRARVVLVQMRADVARFGRIIDVEGEADGGDIVSRVVATWLGQAHDPYPVNTAIDGPWPAAGHRRNARMDRDGRPVEGRAFIVGDVGTPFSRGSAGMVEILRIRGVPVIIHRDNGIEVQP